MNKKPKFKNKMIWLLKHSLVIIILIFSIIDYTCKMCNCPLNYYQKNDPQMLLTLIPLAITVVSISLTLTSDKIENVSIFEFRNFRSKFYFTFQEMMIITLSLFILYFILIHFEIYISILLIEISSIIYSILFIIQELPLLERNDKYITKVIKYAYFNKESKTLNLYIDKKSNNSLSIALTSFLLRNGLKNSFKKFKTSDNSKNKEILKDFMDINTNNLINLVYYSKTKVFDRSINVENIINMSFSNIKDILTFSKDFDLIKIHEDNKHTSISFVSNALINLYTLCDYFGFNELFKNEFNVLFIAFNFKKKNGQEYEIYLDKIFNQIILQTVLNKKYWIINSLINYQKENSLYEEEIFFFIFYMSIIFKNNGNFCRICHAVSFARFAHQKIFPFFVIFGVNF